MNYASTARQEEWGRDGSSGRGKQGALEGDKQRMLGGASSPRAREPCRGVPKLSLIPVSRPGAPPRRASSHQTAGTGNLKAFEEHTQKQVSSAHRVPSIFLASSFRMCLSVKFLKVYFPGGLGTHEARCP